MKKTRFFIATLLVVAAASVAVVSCKKEANDTLLNNTSSQVKTFAPPQVDDMNAYLKGFKQKMQNVTREGNETLSLEEAAWHLSSVANYDFCNANVNFTDLRYDTLYYNVNVTNGQVALTDLNALYVSVANDIDAFYQSLNLEDKHFRFIGTSISSNGEVEVSLMTSFRLLNHTWYFSDWFEAGVMCDSLFSNSNVYVWNGLAISELERALNLLEGKVYAMPEEPPVRTYYVYTTDVEFRHTDYSDPYPNESPFFGSSRIYAMEYDIWAEPSLDLNMMCYCLDSYLQLPFEYVNTHSNMVNQRPVHWDIVGDKYKNGNSRWYIYSHILNVKFGYYVTNENPIQY